MIRSILCWFAHHSWELVFDFKGDFWNEFKQGKVKSYYICKYCGKIKR